MGLHCLLSYKRHSLPFDGEMTGTLMLDEPSQQVRQSSETARIDKVESACPHPDAVGTRWGDTISAARQVELQGYLDRWETETDHGVRRGPLDPTGRSDEDQQRLKLTGADAFWLARQVGRKESTFVPDLHLEGAYLFGAHLEQARLGEAHLQHAYLGRAHLNRAYLGKSNLTHAYLGAAYLEGAELGKTQLEEADLGEAHLESAYLNGANLKGAYLVGAWFDSKTQLSNVSLDQKTRLGDIHWSGLGAVDLTRIDWSHATILGDEKSVRFDSPVAQHDAIVRAYRQLATQLRVQGISEVADRFALRAQIRQRGVLLRRGRILGYLGSWLLAILAGYGYRPGRSILWYLAVIAGFAALYMQVGIVNGHTFNLTEAIVFSLTSFHGRGFFPGGLKLDDPVTMLAAGEAVIGLLIEISFIATFTQRFFGSK